MYLMLKEIDFAFVDIFMQTFDGPFSIQFYNVLSNFFLESIFYLLRLLDKFKRSSNSLRIDSFSSAKPSWAMTYKYKKI